MKLFSKKSYPKSIDLSQEGIDLSFCITHQNRFEYLKKTLKKNLEDNLSLKEKIEFVLVDFSLDTDIKEWIRDNFMSYIKDGYLKFFQTDQMPKWSASIAKNTAHQLAEGAILTNLDCDNFIGEDGAKFVIDQFGQADREIILWQYSGEKYDGSFGRISISAEAYRRLGGYDESLLEMGWQDNDLMKRGKVSGLKLIKRGDKQFNQAIKHEKYEPENMSYEMMNHLNRKQAKGNIRKGLLVANGGRFGLTKRVLQMDSKGDMNAIPMNKELIIIGMGTYKRPKMLKEALQSLRKIKVNQGIEIKLVIIANENNAKIEGLIEDISANFPFEVYYNVELKRGIVHVRNRIVDEALKLGGKYLAFLDDDETVSSSWIEELYKCIKKYSADAVEGLVKYNLATNAPSWIFKKDFYGKRQRKTGSKLLSASTNNVIVSMNFVAHNCLEFDDRLNETGSSDTYFFRKLISKGGKLVWCNEAISYETVPETRATKEWILRRSYKTGYTIVLINTIRFGKGISNVILPFHILKLMFGFLFSLIIHPPINMSNRVFISRELMIAKGSLDAFFGKKMHYYKVIHGN